MWYGCNIQLMYLLMVRLRILVKLITGRPRCFFSLLPLIKRSRICRHLHFRLLLLWHHPEISKAETKLPFQRAYCYAHFLLRATKSRKKGRCYHGGKCKVASSGLEDGPGSSCSSRSVAVLSWATSLLSRSCFAAWKYISQTYKETFWINSI